MIQRMVASAVFAGFAAGLLAALLHFGFVQKFILLAEQYESGAMTHFAGASETEAAAGPAADATGHDEAQAPSDLARNALTVLFASLVQVAYALLLVAGYALADHYGRRINARDGLLWGLAGFAAFQLAPAMGLPPNLPGTLAAAYDARLIWWWGTVLATGTALALLGYGRGPLAIGMAAVLLAAPHVIGAPQLDQFSGVAPPEVASAFAARVLGVSFTVWAILGWLSARIWSGKTA